jgi:hypothetical protein
MPTKKGTGPIATIAAKARALLGFVRDRTKDKPDWLKLHGKLFGARGKATGAFATEAERTAFCKTKEYQSILALISQLPGPPPMQKREIQFPSKNGRSANRTSKRSVNKRR